MNAARHIRLWLVTAALSLMLGSGCGDDGIDFETGDFDVSTTVVDDRCLDGGLNLLFMPLGAATPWQWPFPVAIHSPKDLPVTYDITLREPFGQMTISASDSGPNQQLLVADTNVGVLLGEEQFGQCVVDMDAEVQVTAIDGDHVEGIASLQMTNPRGDERCPKEMPASCSVVLQIEAVRSGS